MRHILFGLNTNDLQVAILIKGSALNKVKIERHYISQSTLLKPKNFIAFDLWYNDQKKCPATKAKEYLTDLLVEIDELGLCTIMVCDAPYFKFLTNNKKADPNYGYVCPCTVKGYGHLNVILCPNYQAMMYNPDLQGKVDRAIKTLDNHLSGSYMAPGTGIIHSTAYPSTPGDIQIWLEQLQSYPELTCDIEARSLEFWNCGISSIAFAWDKHNGVAFGVDRGPEGVTPTYRSNTEKQVIRDALIRFFLTYKGKLIWHNVSFDGKVLVYQLFMEHLADYAGMLKGIEVFTKDFDDTKLIAYMATNNAVRNVLSLKELSAEFTGNYAQEDIKDTDKIPYPQLLTYNLEDTLATWYVKEKFEPIIIADEQQELYEGLIKESVPTLMQTELCGMPINPDEVQVAKSFLTDIVDTCQDFFKQSQVIQAFHKQQQVLLVDALTTKAKKKVYELDDPIVTRYVFNPGSDTQLRRLLYDYFGLPVLDLTKGKQPACGNKTIKKLQSHTKDKAILEVFDYLLKLGEASIILTTFIPAFENAQQLPDGSWRLFGNFNLGGTQSLRLSSSKPNLQNIPSGSVFAKLVKRCFRPNNDWLFGGSDFDALEDKTGALLTRDPQRLKIYTEGFCGHCLRAQYYWPEKMPDIDPASVDSINSIKKKYGKIRQDSKAPSFALQYSGTYITLMKNCGFSEKEARAIETNYHKLYQVSDEWVADLIEKAKNDGYILLAFGGRIRTPLLAKTVGNGRSVPYTAKAEARSAGNAATQSYCILTLRAFNEFMRRVWASKYKYLILPAGTIHDAIYLMVINSAEIVTWVNKNLIECMAWQELKEIKHPQIKMSSGLEIFWPSWANGIEIPNNQTVKQIKNICIEAEQQYREKEYV